MAEHTPGPWTPIEQVTREPGEVRTWWEVHAFASNGIGSKHVAHIPSEADARLIAAAPDLLAALEDLVGYCDNCGGTGMVGDNPCRWCSPARAAIAKAKGEA